MYFFVISTLSTQTLIWIHIDLGYHWFYLEITWKIHGILCHKRSGNPASVLTHFEIFITKICRKVPGIWHKQPWKNLEFRTKNLEKTWNLVFEKSGNPYTVIYIIWMWCTDRLQQTIMLTFVVLVWGYYTHPSGLIKYLYTKTTHVFSPEWSITHIFLSWCPALNWNSSRTQTYQEGNGHIMKLYLIPSCWSYLEMCVNIIANGRFVYFYIVHILLTDGLHYVTTNIWL